MSNIVTLTMNPAVDTGTQTDQVVPERKIRCNPPAYDPGGGGINVSRAIAHLGGSSKAVYPVGGTNGELFEFLLSKEKNIRRHPVYSKGMTRKNLTVYEESSGNQYRFGMPGPKLSSEERRACLTVIKELDSSVDYCVASGSLPEGLGPGFYGDAADILREKGIKFILDTSEEELLRGAEKGCFLLKPNIAELQYLTGQNIVDESSLPGLIASTMERYPVEHLVVSLGSDGIMHATRDKPEKVDHITAPTVPIRSKVGAGDSMVAGIVLSLARGDNFDTALLYGVAAGTAAVMTPGTELCRKDDTERLFLHLKEKYE